MTPIVFYFTAFRSFGRGTIARYVMALNHNIPIIKSPSTTISVEISPLYFTFFEM